MPTAVYLRTKKTIKRMSEIRKGKHHTEETKRKIAISNTGKHPSEEVRKKMSERMKGEKNPWWGKHRSEETRRKISQGLKGDKNWNWGKHKKLSEETRRKISAGNKGRKGSNLGKHLSEEWKRKIGIANKGKLRGSKSPAWKGGITPVVERIRKTSKYKEWRQKVFIRDNFTCQKCKKKESGKLNAHHKYPFCRLIQEAINYMPLLTKFDACLLYTPLWDLDNGITLCEKCHHNKTKKIFELD